MSPEARGRDGERARPSAVFRLLDPAFGLFVWAGYFTAVYVAQAVACSVWPGMAPATKSAVAAALVVATLAAIAVAAVHAGRRYRGAGAVAEGAFLARLAVALDAVAVVAIAWMLIPIVFTPLCA